jgi:hypothetical protein
MERRPTLEKLNPTAWPSPAGPHPQGRGIQRWLAAIALAGVTYPHFLIAVIAMVSRCMTKFIGNLSFCQNSLLVWQV